MAPHRARLAPQQGRLRAEAAEIGQHRHAALEKRHVIAEAGRLARRADVGRHPRQPDVEQVARRVLDQQIELIGPHPGLVLGRFEILEAGVDRQVHSGRGVIFQPDRLCQPAPAVDHVAHDGVPIEVGGTLPGGGKRLLIVLRYLLDRVARVLGGELGHERPNGYPVRLPVAHRLHIAGEPLLVTLLHLGGHLISTRQLVGYIAVCGIGRRHGIRRRWPIARQYARWVLRCQRRSVTSAPTAA